MPPVCRNTTLLPKASRLKSLLANLGLSLDSPDARELLYAYLGDVLGSEDLLAALKAAPSADPAPASWLVAENAARQAIGQRTIQLDLRQYEALAKDRTLRYADCEAFRAALSSFLAQTAPTTDNDRVARFLQTLFGRSRLTRRSGYTFRRHAGGDLSN